MESNEIVKAEILKVVDEQIKLNDPIETKNTIDRLIEDGHTESDAKILIAQCVSVEIFGAMKNKKPFNRERYVQNLNNLPNPPFDDEYNTPYTIIKSIHKTTLSV